jgi:CHAT domain-containing protein/tetratricopeptide (TPR) repeat protein
MILLGVLHHRMPSQPEKYRTIARQAVQAGEPLKALASFGQAIAEMERLRQWGTTPDFEADLADCHLERADVYSDLKNLHAALGDQTKAIEIYQRLRILLSGNAGQTPDVNTGNLQELGAEHPGAAGAYLARGTTLAGLNQTEAATSDFSRAIAIYRWLVDTHHINRATEKLAAAYNNRAYAYNLLKRYQEALEDADRASALFAAMGDELEHVLDHAGALVNRANALLELARPEAALDVFNQAIKLYGRFASSDHPDVMENLAGALTGRGQACIGLLQFEIAISEFERAATIYEWLSTEARRSISWSDYLNVILSKGFAHIRKEQFDAAHASFRQAVSTSEQLIHIDGHQGLEKFLGAALLNRAFVLKEQRRPNEAEADLLSALRIFRRVSKEKSQQLDEELGMVLTALGELKADNGEWQDAAAFFEEAVEFRDRIAELAVSDIDRTKRMTKQANLYSGLVAAYSVLAEKGDPAPASVSSDVTKVASGTHSAYRAAYWAERGRARNLADWMNAATVPPRGVPASEYDEYLRTSRGLRDTDQRLQDVERRLAQVRSDDPSRPELDRIVGKQTAHRAELLNILNQLRLRFIKSDPSWAPGAPPLSIDAICETARMVGAGLLTLRPSKWGSCAVLVLPTARVEAKLFSGINFENAVHLLLGGADPKSDPGWIGAYWEYRLTPWWHRSRKARELTWHAVLEKTMAKIGESLWKDLHAWLRNHYPPNPDHLQPLVLLPAFPLIAFPLHAATWDEGGRSQVASDHYQMSYAPGVAILSRCQMQQRRSVGAPSTLLAVRNPTAPLASSSLVWTEFEVDEASRFISNRLILSYQGDTNYEPATRDRVRQEIPRYNVVLLATHGTYDLTNPWIGSGIYTADASSSSQTGPSLTLADFYEIDLSRTQLVILTACESALVTLADTTGEQLGLPSALIATGAATVIGSLWLVNDLATALISRHLFRVLFDSSDKMIISPGRALWHAQRMLRDLSSDDVARILHQIEVNLPSETPGAPTGTGLTRASVQAARASTLARGARPFAHPVYWAGFGCYGSVSL